MAFLDRDEIGSEVGTTAYHGGLVIERVGGLHPARYHAGLVRYALAGGAELHPVTRVTSVERRPGGGFRVGTARGALDCADVVMATNADADGVVPGLRRRVLPVGSFIVATEPLDARLQDALIPRRRMVFDTRHLLSYWRLSPDGRMVFGGRTSLAPTSVARARDALYDEMVRIHPQLAGARVARAWGGRVAITIDRLPHVGRMDGITYATGCNGTGIALNTWLGTRVAAWVTGGEPPPFADLSFRRVPLHGLRALWLPLVGAWFRALDRIGR